MNFLAIDKGANLDKQDECGNTALHVVAWGGGEEIAKALIDKGADLDKQNNGGATALSLAKEVGHSGMVKLLEQEKVKKEAEFPNQIVNFINALPAAYPAP